MDIALCKFGRFTVIILMNISSMPLAYTLPLSMPMICKFALSMFSHRSHMPAHNFLIFYLYCLNTLIHLPCCLC